MYLARIKISNILSFPYVGNLNAVKGTCFADSAFSHVSLLIGPNGSGKSTFLEIVNQVFKVGLMKDFVLHTTPLKENAAERFGQVLEEKPQRVRYLAKHFASEAHKSQVYVRLQLQQGDYDNIKLVYEHRELLARIIVRYSSTPIAWPQVAGVDALLAVDDLAYYLTLDYDNQTFVKKRGGRGAARVFWSTYIEYFELLQLALVLHNHYLMGEPLPSLHTSFATLGSQRTFTDQALTMPVGRFSGSDLDDLIYAQDTKRSGQMPIGYYLCKKRLLEHYQQTSFAVQQSVLASNEVDDLLADLDQDVTYHTHFVSMLQSFVRRYVGYELLAEIKYDKILLFFVDDGGHRLRLSDLSSGEQSFLYVIFTLFGYGLEHGVCVIDEPELHLHPGMQERMLELLEDMAQTYHLQLIVATHSPLFVTSSTIKHVLRVSRGEAGTWLSTPVQAFGAHEGHLVQMLQQSYTTKVFFADVIIMVEGETDEYFVSFYLRWWLARHGLLVGSFAVINVNGKGGYRRWRKFLRKFGIRAYFLGDWDAIADTGFRISFGGLISEMKRRYYGKQVRGRKKSYGRLVSYIQQAYPALAVRIGRHIQGLRAQGIYLLQYGDLEAYLGLRLKGVVSTVAFCQEDFGMWLKDPHFDRHREDLDGIFGDVFGVLPSAA